MRSCGDGSRGGIPPHETTRLSSLQKNYNGISRTSIACISGIGEKHPAGCSKRPDFSPARPESAKTASSPRDAPCPKQGRSELSQLRGGWDDPNCAHRTSTVSSCTFCEQEGHLAAPFSFFSGSRVVRARGLSQPPRLFFSILFRSRVLPWS